MKTYRTIAGLIPSLLFFCASVIAQNEVNNGCLKWQAEVDKSMENIPNILSPAKLKEPEILNAIECLLNLEGNNNEARFSGATNGNVSAVPPPATVEVASLYYISYLYYQRFDHANMIALIGEGGKYNIQRDIIEAYESYRKWFEQVKKIGLKKARKQKLDPLAYTTVKWY